MTAWAPHRKNRPSSFRIIRLKRPADEIAGRPYRIVKHGDHFDARQPKKPEHERMRGAGLNDRVIRAELYRRQKYLKAVQYLR